MILNHFKGINQPLAALKIAHLEQLNNDIFTLLLAQFSFLKIAHLIERIAINKNY